MYLLLIEHPVLNYDGWKKAFDSDPIGREKSGVLRYRVLRPADNPNYVIIELEFDDLDKTKKTLAALQEMWKKVEGKLIENVRARIVEITEIKEY